MSDIVWLQIDVAGPGVILCILLLVIQEMECFLIMAKKVHG